MIGLATSREFPDLVGGEQLLYQELRRRGECRIVFWDDPQESWRECDQIIIRTTWDYFVRVIEFLQWIDKVEAAGIKLHNPPDILRWNSDKLYMRDLSAKGVLIPETTWIARGKLTRDVLRKHVNCPCVLKPTVSGGAYSTFRVSPDNIDAVVEKLDGLAEEKGFMLQPFIPEIVSPGEYSLIFFREKFSHAVLKTPAEGDFRVQSKHGGVYTRAEVSPGVIEQARMILAAVPFDEELLYARVDGVVRDGKFILMELELIEPYLFLEFGDTAAAVLASRV